jgi:hypothetical protein
MTENSMNVDKAEYLRAQKMRNLAIGGGLVVFVVLVFIVTMVRMSQNLKAEAPQPATPSVSAQ